MKKMRSTCVNNALKSELQGGVCRKSLAVCVCRAILNEVHSLS